MRSPQLERMRASLLELKDQLTPWEIGFVNGLEKFKNWSAGQCNRLEIIYTKRIIGSETAASDLGEGDIRGVSTEQGWTLWVHEKQISHGHTRSEVLAIVYWLRENKEELLKWLRKPVSQRKGKTTLPPVAEGEAPF